MVCQEDLFDFFQTISVELEREGYPILDNIIDSDESLSEDDDSGNKKSKEEV